MTREQLDAIRARVEAAPSAAKTSIEIDRDGTTRWVNIGPFLCFTLEDVVKVRDVVTFVHAAPADLRALLAEVERLRDALAMAVQVSGELCEKCGWAMKFPGEKCRCELLTEVERLTAERGAAFSRGVAAMREAAAHRCWLEKDTTNSAFFMRHIIHNLPDPEDKS